VTIEQEKLCAAFILRLLLDETGQVSKPDEVRWEDLLKIARRNAVLVRVAERLQSKGAQPPEDFIAAVEDERRLNREKLELIGRVSRSCEESGVEFIFAKSFHHYPDMGDDIDMYVLRPSAEVDALILKGMKAAPHKRSLSDRLAAAACYTVPGCRTRLEIHHGRTWAYGEHHSFIATIIKDARRVQFEGEEFSAPSPEDLLIMEGTQRVYARRYIRLAPIAYMISSIRRDNLDWGYVLETARRFGAFLGLSCYLAYVNQIHRQVFGTDLLAENLRESLMTRGWGQVEFRGGAYRFPHLRVARKIYLSMLRTAVWSGNLKSFSRLCLAPLVAATAMRRKSVSQ
jgi:Uncharacterised nucleotidyltransferase